MSVPPGRTVLITGATDGLGRCLATRLAHSGVHVIACGRDPERGRTLQDEIVTSTGRTHVDVLLADFAELGQVDRLAGQVLDRFGRLDALVNNAAVGSGRPGDERQLSHDGIELRFAVNYLAGYHLTRRLLPLLVKSAPSRVVNVSSAAQRSIDFNDPMLRHGYDGMRAYAQSKLAQIMFTFDLADELREQRVAVNALHPATFMDTAMMRETGQLPLSTVEDGARTTWPLVMDAEGVTGRYFHRDDDALAEQQAYDPRAREKLRLLSDELVARALAAEEPGQVSADAGGRPGGRHHRSR